MRRPIRLVFGRLVVGLVTRLTGWLAALLAAPARLGRRQVIIIILRPIAWLTVIVRVGLIRVGRPVIWIIIAAHWVYRWSFLA